MSKLYRSRHGVFLGVCRGVAEYFGLSVFWLRTFTVILFFWTGGLPVLFTYLALGLLLRSAPEVQDRYTGFPPPTFEEILALYKQLERRVVELEHRMGTGRICAD
mgnify:CR=1 FL=1